jgi:hypothetical protein
VSATDFASGLYGSLYRRMALQRQAQLDAIAENQRQFENQRQVGADQRAQQQLDETSALRKLEEADRAANLKSQEEDRTLNRANALADQIPANTFLQATDPAVGLLRTGGRGSLLTSTPAIPAQPDFQGPMPEGGPSLQDVNQGRASGFIKTPSAKQQQTAADTERKDWQAGIQQQLADLKNDRQPTSSYQLQPEIDPATGKQTGRYLGYNTKLNRWEPVQGQGPAATKAGPQERPLPYQAAENAASLNTAEVEGVKVLKALRETGLDQSNDPADPRWQKFVVTTLKVAPEDFQKADIQQRTAFVNAALTRQLMGGRPSQYVAQILQQHLPQGAMSGRQLTHVLHNVLQQSGEKRTELQQMLPGVKGPASGQSYADYLTELANGPTPTRTPSAAAPSNTVQAGGKTYTFPTPAAADAFRREMGIQ